jgi:hypothetical protein
MCLPRLQFGKIKDVETTRQVASTAQFTIYENIYIVK